ncbi:MAG: threonine synthase [Acidobacteria bacterium]|jgi:threonine synthase|nr:threonine synthase [Acidobacteriota bacterium]
MRKMVFYSTNGQSPRVSLAEALMKGQAPDKGLYMPEFFPTISREEIEYLRGKSYPEVATYILNKYCEGTFNPELIADLCEDAYTFPVPLEKVTPNRYVMRLDQGPTASFKDFAARMMARMIGALRQGAEKELVILTATSGDTGSAVANAFYKVPNIRVMVLFPITEVSDRQRKQMTTLGHNITTVAVDGKFDDCQALVKRAFADPKLNHISLSSANSINIGRLLPQSVYYIYAYTQLTKEFEPVIFCIPSGNFGNMMGALLAAKMGFPIRKIIVAANENDEVPEYFRTHFYKKIEPSRCCISNAMNVGHPSNFARVIDIYGGHMDETGKIHRPPDLEKMKNDIWAISITDQETRDTIRSAWQTHRLLLEPHGAVGWAGLEHFCREFPGFNETMISVETAHPAKFPDEIEKILGFNPEIPKSLSDLDQKEESFLNLSKDYDGFYELLIQRYGQ